MVDDFQRRTSRLGSASQGPRKLSWWKGSSERRLDQLIKDTAGLTHAQSCDVPERESSKARSAQEGPASEKCKVHKLGPWLLRPTALSVTPK